MLVRPLAAQYSSRKCLDRMCVDKGGRRGNNKHLQRLTENESPGQDVKSLLSKKIQAKLAPVLPWEKELLERRPSKMNPSMLRAQECVSLFLSPLSKAVNTQLPV
jgi:hypothetical protein